MKQELYACLHVADLPVQALLRLRHDLKSLPIAVLQGSAPHETVCSINQHARQRGASVGMSRLEAEGVADLFLLSRSPESETAASSVILECASQFSPRIEQLSDSTSCILMLDITGTERLFGPAARLAQSLRLALINAGFRASIAISSNFDTARLKSAGGRGIIVIAKGEEARTLSDIPIECLGCSSDALVRFAFWGIRTLGELAKLPETELVIRLGPNASNWRNLACGNATHTFRPIEPSLSLEEFCEFEIPVEQIDSLLFVLARMIDSLVTRAARRALSLASISALIKLEHSRLHQCTIRPALPSADRKFLLKLMQLELASRPPQAAVVALRLSAEAGPSSQVQLGLFIPQAPEPSRLDVTLARLKAIVGEDRVGAPVLEDSHRPGTFRIEHFSLHNNIAQHQTTRVRMALRRMRPPLPIRVVFRGAKPVAFRDENDRFEIAAAYGPWKTAGCWWSTDSWDLEEWDVQAFKDRGSTISCLLVHDLKHHEWLLEAMYD
jgi:protein ImuB